MTTDQVWPPSVVRHSWSGVQSACSRWRSRSWYVVNPMKVDAGRDDSSAGADRDRRACGQGDQVDFGVVIDDSVTRVDATDAE